MNEMQRIFTEKNSEAISYISRNNHKNCIMWWNIKHPGTMGNILCFWVVHIKSNWAFFSYMKALSLKSIEDKMQKKLRFRSPDYHVFNGMKNLTGLHYNKL